MKKLLIVGSGENYTAENTCLSYYDTVWGMATNLFHPNMPKMDLIFELHKKDVNELNWIYNKMRENNNYKYMVNSKIDGVKHQKLYPFEEIIKKYGRYISSSFTLLLLYAVEQGFDYISFAGVGYGAKFSTWRELITEKANLEYWIGYFEGKGINISTRNCPYLKRSAICYGYDKITPIQKYRAIDKQNLFQMVTDRLGIDSEQFFKEYEKILKEEGSL